jgi:hypothetical protein
VVASSLYRCLAGRTHGGKRDDIDVPAGKLSPRRRAFGQSSKNRFEAVMTRVMKMVRFGGSQKNPVNARAQ